MPVSTGKFARVTGHGCLLGVISLVCPLRRANLTVWPGMASGRRAWRPGGGPGVRQRRCAPGGPPRKSTAVRQNSGDPGKIDHVRVRDGNLLFLLLALALIALVFRVEQGSSIDWNYAGFQLGDPASARTWRGEKDFICANPAIAGTAYCAYGNFQYDDDISARFYKRKCVYFRGVPYLERAGTSIAVGMTSQEVMLELGEPTRRFSRTMVYEEGEILACVLGEDRRVESLHVIRPFTCSEHSQHRCGYHPGWWFEYLKTADDILTDNPWPWSARTPL